MSRFRFEAEWLNASTVEVLGFGRDLRGKYVKVRHVVGDDHDQVHKLHLRDTLKSSVKYRGDL